MPVCRSAHLPVRRRSSSGRVVDVTVELDLEAATSCAAVRVDLSLRRRSGERGTRRRLSPSPGSAEPRVCCQVSLSKHRPGQPVTPRWWTGRPVVGHWQVDPRVIGPKARRPDHRTHLECPTVGEPHRRIAGVHRTAVELHAMPPSERPGARAHERLPPGHPVAQLRLLRRAEEAGLRPASRCSPSSSPPAASSSCARSPPAAHLQGQRDRDLDTLERRRLVGRRRLEHDRRAAVVAITPPGQELVERLFPEHSSCVARAFAPLGDDEKRTLVELCRKLAAT